EGVHGTRKRGPAARPLPRGCFEVAVTRTPNEGPAPGQGGPSWIACDGGRSRGARSELLACRARRFRIAAGADRGAAVEEARVLEAAQPLHGLALAVIGPAAPL